MSSRCVFRNCKGEDTEHDQKSFAYRYVCRQYASDLPVICPDDGLVFVTTIPPTLSKCLLFPHVIDTHNTHGRSEEGTYVALTNDMGTMQQQDRHITAKMNVEDHIPNGRAAESLFVIFLNK